MQINQEFQNIILSSVDLTTLISLGKKTNLETVLPKEFVYFKLTKKQLTQYYGESPTFDNIEIMGARLFINRDNRKFLNSVVYLKMINGRRMVIPISPSQHNCINEIFKKAGDFYDLYGRRGKNPYAWHEGVMTDHYDSETDEHYEFLHNQIKDSLKKLIKDKGYSTLNIVDGGCGTGKFLRKIIIELENELKSENVRINLRLFGFDINGNNIDLARKELEEIKTTADCQVQCRFEIGDLTKTDEVIAKFLKVNNEIPHGDLTIDRNSRTVLILSGSLTRLVLKDVFEALTALQSIVKSGFFDFIIGGGVGEPLINNYIEKQLGYKKLLLDFSQNRFPVTSSKSTKFFACEQLTLDEVLENKFNKLIKYNELDLSLSAQPEIILNALFQKLDILAIKDNMIIDLSFVNLSSELVNELKNITNKYTNAKLRIWHNNRNCIDRIISDYDLKLKLLEAARHVTDEIYLLNSRRFFDILSPLKIIKLLLQKGVSPYEIFIQAVKLGNIDIMKFLLDQGININQPDKNGMTPFHYAAQNNQVIALRLLTDLFTTNLNIKNNEGNTIAHLATHHIEVLLFLCDMDGIDWNVKNNQGQTPVYLVAMRTVEFILLSSDDKDYPSTLIFKNILKLIADAGGDLNQVISLSRNDDDIIELVEKIRLTKEEKQSHSYLNSKLSFISNMSQPLEQLYHRIPTETEEKEKTSTVKKKA